MRLAEIIVGRGDVLTVTLRDYQSELVEDTRRLMREGKRKVVCVLPTGGGKSLICASVAKGVVERDKLGIIMAHRQELLDQLSVALDSFDVSHAMIEPGARRLPRANMLVGSVQTLARRIPLIAAPDFIFVDECHHAVRGGQYAKIIQAFPNALVMGLSASPARLDGRGLGEMFDGMAEGPSVAELTERGYLVPGEVWSTAVQPDLSGVKTAMGDYQTAALADAMDKPRITGDAVKHYARIAPGKAAVVFCVSVKHAHDVAADFCAAGYKFVALDGNTYGPLRKQYIDDLRTGKIHGICSAEIISEGVDVPRIECAIMLRPTQSLMVYTQQLGRGLRPYPGKEKCIILDHAGLVQRFGLPDEPREWSLDGAPRRKSSDKPPPVRTCNECFAAHRPAPKCPRCGYVYPIASRQVEQVDGELALVVDPKRIKMDELLAEPARAKEYEFLLRKARQKGYKDAWAWHVVASKEAKRRMKRIAGG